ncbi:MAG TPA: TrmH family RNA methyltransferase [Solirubrobacterales bacterium]|nr:TrmH family RNA methyltransferase [Solirubrobacterales bacterium]
MSGALFNHYKTAWRDPELVILEGFHALKHALRFGAEVLEAVASRPEQLEELAADLAPDLLDTLRERVTPVDDALLGELVPQAPYTGVVAIARRPEVDVGAALADSRPAPIVLLEEPRNLGNMGACVRVAAAADAAGVFVTGSNDPWHAEAVRAAAGLSFALPVRRIDALPDSDRPLIAIDPEGGDLRPAELPPRAVLAFGTERHGLSEALLERADQRLGIPMRPGVSSLNLATTVSAVLFAQRLA